MLDYCFMQWFIFITNNWNYRYCFPFGRPEGSLKATLSLLERVLMKDIVTPVPPEEVRSMIKKSLETAALVNYTRLSEEAKIDGKLKSRMQFSISTQYAHIPFFFSFYVSIWRRLTWRCDRATGKETGRLNPFDWTLRWFIATKWGALCWGKRTHSHKISVASFSRISAPIFSHQVKTKWKHITWGGQFWLDKIRFVIWTWFFFSIELSTVKFMNSVSHNL